MKNSKWMAEFKIGRDEVNMSWWAHLDSNQGPPDYESGALTNWAIGPEYCLNIQKKYAKIDQ